MAKEETIQTSFVGGEFAPSLLGRTTIAQYANACSVLENMLIRPYGSALSCPGTEFISDARYTTVVSNSGVVLYLKFESDFTDSSTYNNTPIINGDASINNSDYIVGTGSGEMTVDGDGCVGFANSSIFNVSNNDFIIDCYFKGNVISLSSDAKNIYYFIYKGYQGQSSLDYEFLMTNGTYSLGGENYHNLAFIFKSGTTTYTISSKIIEDIIGIYSYYPHSGYSLSADTWYNVRCERNNGNINLFFNGNKLKLYISGDPASESSYSFDYPIGNTTINYTANINSKLVVGGNIPSTSLNGFLDGKIDELYFINGNVPSGLTTRVYGKAKLFPFIFSRSDAYIIELGETYFRFFTDGAQVQA